MLNYRTIRRRLLNSLIAMATMISSGFPQRKLILIGITGTDGKTTTTHLLSAILEADGRKVGYISTIEAKIGQRSLSTGLHTSTPGPRQIYQLLRIMVGQQVSHVIIEATSHGLDQYRMFGLRFATAAITNISPEHLDYHKTIHNYTQAKARLIKASQSIWLSLDNHYTAQLAQNHPHKAKTFSLTNSANLQATNIINQPQLSTFNLQGQLNLTGLHLNLPGMYNVSNSLAAIGMAADLGVDSQVIAKGLAATSAVQGRWQVVQQQPFMVVIDFAHTPQAFAQVLPFAQQLAHQHDGRLIHVFGSAAHRDTSKRAEMGSLSAAHANLTILTMEDPRTESLDAIQNMLSQGLKDAGKIEGQDWYRIDDRQQAIRRAIQLAQLGDIVLLTGKGHEQSLAIGNQELPWSELEAAQQALAQATT